MFGTNGPCPSLSPSEYLPPFNILDPPYYSCDFQLDNGQQQMDSSETECHSSAPPTPDVISGIMSLAGSADPCSPELSSGGSYGDVTSPEDYHSVSSPCSYPSHGPIDVVSGVQATRTKLIKEGLKLTIQARRIVHGLDTVRPEYRQPLKEELTHEDEERRRKRRERNKVAATKCRNKKKERTGRLAIESESLEINNSALRHEIHGLEKERKELMDLLRGHIPHCEASRVHAPCAELQGAHNHTRSWSATAASSVMS